MGNVLTIHDMRARDFINNINRLVKDSFGRGFYGNWVRDYSVDEDFLAKKNDELGTIAKEHWFSCKLTEAGEFKDENGAVIEIEESFIHQAEKYARLYERYIGGYVDIIPRQSL